MKNLKVGDVVIAPEGCRSYLTAGKNYPISGIIKNNIFVVIDDEGDRIYTGLTNSGHLNGQDCVVKSEVEETTPLKSKTKQTLTVSTLVLVVVAFILVVSYLVSIFI